MMYVLTVVQIAIVAAVEARSVLVREEVRVEEDQWVEPNISDLEC